MPDKKWSLQIHFSYRKAAVFLLSLSCELGLPQGKHKQGGIFPATVPPAYIFIEQRLPPLPCSCVPFALHRRAPLRGFPLWQRAGANTTPGGVVATGLETAASRGMAQHLRQVLEGQRED